MAIHYMDIRYGLMLFTHVIFNTYIKFYKKLYENKGFCFSVIKKLFTSLSTISPILSKRIVSRRYLIKHESVQNIEGNL